MGMRSVSTVVKHVLACKEHGVDGVLVAGLCIALSQQAATCSHRLGVLRLRPPAAADQAEVVSSTEPARIQAQLAAIAANL